MNLTNSTAYTLDDDASTQTSSLTCYGIEALTAWLDTKPKRLGDDASETYDDSDCAGLSQPEAQQIARDGGSWAEGSAALEAVTLPTSNVQKPRPRRRLNNNMVGMLPNVPVYLAGHPMAMLDLPLMPAKKKILRIGVHVGRTWGVEQTEVFNRGRAIMAVVDDLTLEGYAVELWAVWRNEADGRRCHVDVLLKPSNAPWIASDVAFALANIAFQRRLCWDVAERTKYGAYVSNNGHGNGQGCNRDDFDIFYGYVTMGKKYSTVEKAVDSIKATSRKQLDKAEAA